MRLSVRESNERLQIVITNPVSVAAPPDPDFGNGTGLRHVRDRLRLLFGETATFAFDRNSDFVRVEVVIPLQNHQTTFI